MPPTGKPVHQIFRCITALRSSSPFIFIVNMLTTSSKKRKREKRDASVWKNEINRHFKFQEANLITLFFAFSPIK